MAADASRATLPQSHNTLPWVVRLWWLWAALALITGAVTIAAAGGFNIVDLELAGTLERADEVVVGVDAGTIQAAIYWDFLFIVFYALALCTGALWARGLFGGGIASRIGMPVAIGAVLAGALDIVENLSMLGYLNGWSSWAGWIPLARVMAVSKFLLVFVAIVYVLVGIGIRAVRSLSGGATGR